MNLIYLKIVITIKSPQPQNHLSLIEVLLITLIKAEALNGR